MELHKHEQGVYNILFFDKHGRHLKDEAELGTTLTDSIQLGKDRMAEKEQVKSFVVKCNIYNSVDHY